MGAIRWIYLRQCRGLRMVDEIKRHVVSRPGVASIEHSQSMKAVTYLAARGTDGQIHAWICPWDLSGRAGPRLVGFAAFNEGDDAAQWPAHWFLLPPGVAERLTAPPNEHAKRYRERCGAYASARRVLGPIRKDDCFQLQRALPLADGQCTKALHCIDAKTGVFIALDLAHQPQFRCKAAQLIEAGATRTTLLELASHCDGNPF